MTIKEFTKENENISGIYAIICGETGRSYIGSSVNIGLRIDYHFSQLKNNKHVNQELQSDYNSFGLDTFFVEKLLECHDPELLSRESEIIDQSENLYNKTIGFGKYNFDDSDVDRFTSFVDSCDDKEKCWEWMGGLNGSGYGKFSKKINGKDTRFPAHRVSYFLSNPGSNYKIVVRHKCHNKKCVNPNHLISGSFRDNSKDMVNAGRHPSQKLNWEIVKKLRDKYLQNIYIEIEELKLWIFSSFNIEVSRRQIERICYNKRWIDKDYNPPLEKKKSNQTEIIKEDIVSKFSDVEMIGTQEIVDYIFERYGIKYTRGFVFRCFPGKEWACKRLLTKSQVLEAREMYKDGQKMTDIAKVFNIKYATIRSAIVGSNYKNIL